MVITIIGQKILEGNRTLNAISVWCGDEHKCVLQLRDNETHTIDHEESWSSEQAVLDALEQFDEEFEEDDHEGPERQQVCDAADHGIYD